MMKRPFLSRLRLALCFSPLGLLEAAKVSPALAGMSVGCSNCPPSRPADEYREGHVYAGGIYETNSLDEPMLPFLGGRAYEVEHRLGRVPHTITPYLSFTREPNLAHGRPGDNVALAAGNQALIERWDDRVVVVRNDTCADYYLRLVVEADGLGGQGGAN